MTMRKPKTTKKRGPYKKTRDKMVVDHPRNFFREEHEYKGHYISWADAYDRGKGHISIQYKIQGEKKQFRTPRYKTAWLDQKGVDHARLCVANWKQANNNSMGRGKLLPHFYQQHRKEFVRYLYGSAKHSTIQNYENSLEQYVFPYFVGRLQLDNPAKWKPEIISKWEDFLEEHLPNASSRNRQRTALRRYLKFLKRKGIIKYRPEIEFDPSRKRTKEQPLPGQLPEWKDVLVWLKTLPPGKYRFTRAISMGFGLRISEALAIEDDDFMGKHSMKELLARNDYISLLVEKEVGHLFLNINKAKKRGVKKKLIRLIGEEPDNEPKSGTYTACCTYKPLAAFIVEMIANGEHMGSLTNENIYQINKELKISDSPFNFHLYSPHDDRRLNVTLQCFDLIAVVSDAVEVCCFLHAHRGREVFETYFQWGLSQRQIQKRKAGAKLEVI